MKIVFTLVLSASFITASSGVTAEGGFMKAVGKIDNTPEALVLVSAKKRLSTTKHIRELHGDLSQQPEKNVKRKRHLAKFKAALKAQKQQRRLGFSTHTTVTAAF